MMDMALGMGGSTVTVQHKDGPDGKYWEVRSGGNYVSAHPKKSTAVNKARKKAERAGGTLKVYKMNGSLQETTTYGDDNEHQFSVF